MKIRLRIYLVLWATVVGSVDAAELVYRHYTTDDGLPHSNVFRVFQDSKGFIRLGTENGLCRFDGMRFETFDHCPPVQDKQILSIMEALDSTKAGSTRTTASRTCIKMGSLRSLCRSGGNTQSHHWIKHCNINEMFAITHLALMSINTQESDTYHQTLDDYFANYKSERPNIHCVQLIATGAPRFGTDYGLIVLDGDSAKLATLFQFTHQMTVPCCALSGMGFAT